MTLEKVIGSIKLHVLKYIQDGQIFKPHLREIVEQKSPEMYGLDTLTVRKLVTTDNITLECWESAHEKDAPFAVVFHGNTGNWGDVGAPKRGESYDPQYRINLLKALLDKGYGVLAVSVRGYGKSTGKPSEEGIALDMKAVARYLMEAENINRDKICIVGESLGAAYGFMLAEAMQAQEMTPAVITTIAAFESIAARAMEIHPTMVEEKLKASLRHHFNNVERIQKMPPESYIMLLHPEDDEATPKSHSQTLEEVARKSGLRVEYHELIRARHITWSPSEVVAYVDLALSKYLND